VSQTTDRDRAAEARIEELAAERARLWEELHRLRAERRQIEYYEQLASYMQNSISWRITRPLRDAKRIVGMVRKKLAERR
jgi:hypothetical protein